MAFTTRDEVVYMHTPNPHDDGTYSAKGCDVLGECDPSNVAYFNIRPSFMKHAYWLFKHGSLYIPKTVVGTISPGANNKCDVKVYGAYYEKLYQQIDFYPDILDITCVRVDDHDKPISEPVTPANVDAHAVQQQTQTPPPAVNVPSPAP